jgi:hypothetical protein
MELGRNMHHFYPATLRTFRGLFFDKNEKAYIMPSLTFLLFPEPQECDKPPWVIKFDNVDVLQSLYCEENYVDPRTFWMFPGYLQLSAILNVV